MIPNQALSTRFSLYQFTRTDHAEFQEANRMLGTGELDKLIRVAGLLEVCAEIMGCEVDVHSARRCPQLNRAIGGSARSQHMLCEAVDFSPFGPDTEESIEPYFRKLVTAARCGKVVFGQLINESQGSGREGRKVWIHISLGFPFREASRCGQILRMRDGKYSVVA